MDTDPHSYRLHPGSAPLLVSLPHDGTALPQDMAARLTDAARRVPDTDWHVAPLYDFARQLGASILVPRWSRYVVDLNRPPDDTSLYPGQNTTGLVPLRRFTGEPVYLPGCEPDAAEVASRIDTYWRPYHAALRGELERIRAQHGRVTLWEGHSIRGSGLPFLFEGRDHAREGVAREVVPALLTVEVRHCLRTAAPLREDDRYVLSCVPYQFHLGRVDGEWRWVEFAADGEG